MKRSGLLLLLALCPSAAVEPLVLLTWNAGLDQDRPTERWPALVSAIVAAKPDIVALQEAVPAFLLLLAADPGLSGWHWARPQGESVAGLALASRQPLLRSRILDLPSRHGRKALIAWVQVADGELALATVHLDSLLSDGVRRRLQLERVQEALVANPEAVILGDFNFGDGEPEESALSEPWRDAWRGLLPADPGLSWDRGRNPLADANSFPEEPSRRLDRVLLRSMRWSASAARLVGVEPAASGLHPSDHFGLRVELRPADP